MCRLSVDMLYIFFMAFLSIMLASYVDVVLEKVVVVAGVNG